MSYTVNLRKERGDFIMAFISTIRCLSACQNYPHCAQNVTQYVYISRSQYSKCLACNVATALEARSIPPSFSKTHL